jgi:hypothetical protein
MSDTHPTADVAPYPVLFNAWKHHAGWVRGRIARAVAADALEQLAEEVVVIGTRLMDFYHGPLAPDAIGDRVLGQLRDLAKLEEPIYRGWLEGQGGYAMLTLPDEGSRWAVRAGAEGERYVHLHPGRYSPNTVRVQANALKTAILAHAIAQVNGTAASDIAVVNEARKRFLQLPPVPVISEGGLGEVIALLR